MIRLGVLSDTHGYWRPEILEYFAGVGAILHAGDVGDSVICDVLELVAPTYSVRGNVDGALPESSFPYRRTLAFEGVRILLIHRPEDAAVEIVTNPQPYGMVIHGHTHKPRNEWLDGCLWFNPGAAGRERFGRTQDVGIGLVWIEANRIVEARFVPLIRHDKEDVQ
ncbi:MAG: metallophosphoesterase family protein [Acidobacteriota bacterium]